MAKILIGNVKGKDGRGIKEIVKTSSTEAVDTYTIKYTDNTTSTFTINNSNSISIQRQIVPSAAVESSTTASQAYTAGDYVVVGGALRKVTSSITKGSAIGNSNSTATTVTGEIKRVNVATGSVNIFGCTVTLNVFYIPAIRSLGFETKGSGYMTTGAQTGYSAKALTLPSNYRPAHELTVCICANMQLKFGVGLKVQTNGDVLFDITSSAPMNAFGWPAATGLIPL